MSKKIIGYTCGVYDLYHVGHIRILENAKKKCDFLIVGLSTDELSLTKGKKPIYKYDDRKEILLSNRNVDSVIPQVTFDKFSIILSVIITDAYSDDRFICLLEKLLIASNITALLFIIYIVFFIYYFYET